MRDVDEFFILSFEPVNRDVLQHIGWIDRCVQSSRGYETCITWSNKGRPDSLFCFFQWDY